MHTPGFHFGSLGFARFPHRPEPGVTQSVQKQVCLLGWLEPTQP